MKISFSRSPGREGSIGGEKSFANCDRHKQPLLKIIGDQIEMADRHQNGHHQDQHTQTESAGHRTTTTTSAKRDKKKLRKRMKEKYARIDRFAFLQFLLFFLQ